MERTNIRYIDLDSLDKISFISIDVSFISLKLVLPVAFNMLSNDGELVALIKPQFEAGREEVGKKGVVRDIDIHKKVIKKVIDIAYEIGFSVADIDYSPIKGPEGNIEFLIYLKKDNKSENFVTDEKIDIICKQSHEM
jgi:23S rRNA (cytidine1920-2'-O)/16S rRNA (cytidine1409-2'-O)-methyltransferase